MDNLWGSSATTPANRDIDAGAFWPKVPTARFYECYRIPSELPESTVTDYLQQGIIRIRQALSAWKDKQIAAGIAAMAAVPQEAVDGTGELELLFLRAVYCEAKAELLRETATVDRTPKADNAAKTAPETEEKYREFAADALRTITGMDRISIELI